MATPNKWVYCLETTENHPLSEQYKSCLELLDDITKQESDKKIKTPFFNEMALNLDAVELAKNKSSRNSTMDVGFGVQERVNRKINAFILCEYKLNCKSINNIHEKDLIKKVNGSRILLGSEIPIDSKYLFIFKSKIKSTAIHRLKRFGKGKQIFIALDLQDLYNNYFKKEGTTTFE
jgi:hypothetical protein